MREHWRDPGYWSWLWHRKVPWAAKIVVASLLLGLLLGGGWVAAERMTAANAKLASSDHFVLETTVQRLVTVREHGTVIRKLVPVVKKVIRIRPQTIVDARTDYRTQVVRTPGTVRVIRRVITTKVPVVTKQVVTVNGKPRTIVTTRLVPTTKTQTQTQVQTQTRVLTNQQTITNTAPSPTVTQTRTNTVTQTQTLPPVTVTHTETQTQTQAVTNTVTETVTETVNNTETVTVTVTVTVP